MTNKSMKELAYEIVLKEGKTSFTTLCEKIAKELDMSEEELMKRVGTFYTSLCLDGRLVNVGDNKWDLKKNYTYDETHIDVKDFYTEDNSEAEDEQDHPSELGTEEEETFGSSEEEDDDGDSASITNNHPTIDDISVE